jgi:hypothetical protein
VRSFRFSFAMSPVLFLPFNDARHCPLGKDAVVQVEQVAKSIVH